MEISAVVVTLSEEKPLEPVLKSLEGVVSEVIVVDGLGADETPKVGRKFNARVAARVGTSHADRRSFGAELASSPWILSLDADERLSSELREELRALRGREPGCAGFSIPTRPNYLGRWVRHSGWAPDRKVRLFRKDRARRAEDELSGRAAVEGPVEKLRGPVERFAFATIGEHAARVNRASGLAAKELYARGRKARAAHLVALPTLRCLRTYVLKLGVLDGFPGLVIAVLDGYGVFLRYAKLRSIWKKGEHIEPVPY